MKVRVFLTVLLAFLLVGCTMVSAGEQEPAREIAATPTVAHRPTMEPTTLGHAPRFLPNQEPGDGEAQDLVDRATADLQAHLGVSAEKVTVQQVVPAEFPDASLGVPEAGMMYAQVVTPGYVIRLTVGDKTYEYHGSGERIVLVPGAQDPTVGGARVPSPSNVDTSQRSGAEEQTAQRQPVASGAQDPATGWSIVRDETYGFQIHVPQDWTWKELPVEGPGMPDDWPVTRIVHLFPQAWEADLNRSGPPDPNAKPVVAPVQLEVCVGPDEQFRRVYPEPTRSEQIEINGLPVIVEREIFDPMWLARYVFQDPQDPEVRVVLIDYLSGFPDRVTGNGALVERVPAIVATFEFGREL